MDINKNTPVEAPGAGADKKVKFKLDEIGYTDLDGQRIGIYFDRKEFGNLLYFHTPTIEFEEIARIIHANGDAECTREDLDTISVIVDAGSKYNPRTKEAVKEYINNLKGGQ